MIFRPVIIILAISVFSICSAAQMGNLNVPRPGQPTGREPFNSLTGTVVTPDNKPVPNARVELHGSNGFAVGAVYTNSSGTFEFSSVPEGTYEIVASSGVSQTQERLEVSGLASDITLRLPATSTAEDSHGAAPSVSVAQFKVPEKARAAFKKAHEASSKGKDEEAQKLVAKALEIYPKYSDALTLRAVLKMSAADLPGAMADLQQAIDNDENCAWAYIVLGSVFNVEKKFDQAIQTLRRSESLSPSSWQLYFEMGKALVGKGQYEAALRQLTRAQALVPRDYAPIHIVKAHAFFGLNNYSDAMTELQAYLANEPPGPHTAEAQEMMSQAKALVAGSGK